VRPLPKTSPNPLWQASAAWDELEVWRHAVPRRALGYSFAYEVRHNAAIRALHAACSPPARILEVGAGGGNFTLPLAEAGYRVVWNDIRVELVNVVQAKWERGEVDFRPGNVFELTAAEVGPLDAVLATEVIEHCAHPDQFLRHLGALLLPGGVAVLTTPLGSYCRNRLPRFSDWPNPEVFEAKQFLPDADGHIFLLHLDEMKALANSAGFQVRRLETMVTPLTAGHMKLGYLLPILPAPLVRTFERLARGLPEVLRRKLHASMLAVLVKH